MGVSGVQACLDVMPHFDRTLVEAEMLDPEFGIDFLVDSPTKDAGSPYPDDETDDLGLIKVVDDDIEFNVQKVFVSSVKGSASKVTAVVVNDPTPVMTPGVNGPTTSALAVERSPVETDAPSEDFEEVVPVSGGAGSQLAESVVDDFLLEDEDLQTYNGVEGLLVGGNSSVDISARASLEGGGEKAPTSGVSGIKGENTGHPDPAREKTEVLSSGSIESHGLNANSGHTGSAFQSNYIDDLIEYEEDEEEEDVGVNDHNYESEEIQMTDGFAYTPLPCVLLSFGGELHALFNVYQGNLDLTPILDEERHGSIMFESELTYFISELKTYFEVENDVSLQIPSLDLLIHEDMGCAKALTLNRLYEFYMAITSKTEFDELSEHPLKIVMIEHSFSLQKRLADLDAIATEAGFPGYYEEEYLEEYAEEEYPDGSAEGYAFDVNAAAAGGEDHTDDIGEVSGSERVQASGVYGDAEAVASDPLLTEDFTKSESEQTNIAQAVAASQREHRSADEPSPTSVKRRSEESHYEGEVKRKRV